MLFDSREIELLQASIKMFMDSPLYDPYDSALTSCTYKLAHLNSLTRFTEDEIDVLIVALNHCIDNPSVLVEEEVMWGNHVAEHALITWLSCNVDMADHALTTRLIMHCSPSYNALIT